jgi:hypothetical protein
MAITSERHRSAERRELTEADRQSLLFNLAEHTDKQRVDLQKSANWVQLEPYFELIGMMGILQGHNPKNNDESYTGPLLRRQEINHLRKMVALQTRFVPRERLAQSKDFWQEIEDEVGKEMTKVAEFPDDFSRVPRSYEAALDDLSTLKINLVEADQRRSTLYLMNALKKSVALQRKPKK